MSKAGFLKWSEDDLVNIMVRFINNVKLNSDCE